VHLYASQQVTLNRQVVVWSCVATKVPNPAALAEHTSFYRRGCKSSWCAWDGSIELAPWSVL
jgi:hypothetical protein